ncbi:hypothetical protein HPB52_005872 [Rhipicephalus sanguineus]|uniref:Uncharacterized protein n=1 Tax=Rhipicephalus sanguineus TaxID=34632 RepID=A0A9D4PG72_RHISA|nr:hypothetical protein HPB52_005872 [Rhipicephalus sanguineus]
MSVALPRASFRARLLWCVMWFSRAAKRRPGVCLVGLSPNFKKSATSELQVCTTRRVGDLRREERRSAHVLTRPVPPRLIFRAIADEVFMADVLPALDRVYKLFVPPGLANAAEAIVKEFQRRQHIGDRHKGRRYCELQHRHQTKWQLYKRFVPPGLATAAEDIVKEFQRRQRIGDRHKGRRYCELQHRHQTKWQVSLLTRLARVTVFSHDGNTHGCDIGQSLTWSKISGAVLMVLNLRNLPLSSFAPGQENLPP